MKILVVCQYYKPEPFRIADICEELVQCGHEVTVITGIPNYPEGDIYPGYEKGKRREEIVNGVRIHRCFTIPRKTGGLCRMLNYFSFAFSSTAFIKKFKTENGRPFDLVFVNQLSPVMMGNAALAYKKKHKVPAILYCLDLWPESLNAGGIRRGSLVYRIFHKISARIYCGMDRILITSGMFADYLQKEFGIAAEQISYLPQYAENIFEELPHKKLGDTVDLMFAGNVGVAQSVQTILMAAMLLKDEYPQVRWHIVGGGSELQHLQQMAIENHLEQQVVFYGRCPLEKMPVFYQMADAMLVTLQADPVLSLTLPGKVQSYMAAGKPLIGAIDGETATVIKQSGCGFCGRAEDANELAENVKAFIEFDNKEALGKNAGTYYKKFFCRNLYMDRLEKEFKQIMIKQEGVKIG